MIYGKHISNCSGNIFPDKPFRSIEDSNEYQMYIKAGLLFGKPKATPFLTVEQLEKMGMRGVYEPFSFSIKQEKS